MNDIVRSRQGVMNEDSMRSTLHVMARHLMSPVTFSSMLLEVILRLVVGSSLAV